MIIIKIARNTEFVITGHTRPTVVVRQVRPPPDHRQEVDHEADGFGDAVEDERAEEADEVVVVVAAHAGVEELAVVVEALDAVVARPGQHGLPAVRAPLRPPDLARLALLPLVVENQLLLPQHPVRHPQPLQLQKRPFRNDPWIRTGFIEAYLNVMK